MTTTLIVICIIMILLGYYIYKETKQSKLQKEYKAQRDLKNQILKDDTNRTQAVQNLLKTELSF